MIGEINPIKPSEVVERKLAAIPNEMIQAVNECIVEHWNGDEVSFTQDEIIERYFTIIDEPNTQSNREKLFGKHYLNFEPIFEKSGWNVYYDRPAYDETYPARFTFTVKRKKTR